MDYTPIDVPIAVSSYQAANIGRDFTMQAMLMEQAGTGGALFRMSSFTLDIGLEVNMLNLFGKKWEDANPTVDQRLDTYLSLNDNIDPAYLQGSNTHIVSNSRTINTFAITATAMFGL